MTLYNTNQWQEEFSRVILLRSLTFYHSHSHFHSCLSHSLSRLKRARMSENLASNQYLVLNDSNTFGKRERARRRLESQPHFESSNIPEEINNSDSSSVRSFLYASRFHFHGSICPSPKVINSKIERERESTIKF